MKTLTLVRRIGALASWFGPSLLVFGAETTFGSRDFFPNPPAPQTTCAPYGNAGNLPVSVPEMNEEFNGGSIDIDAPHQGQTPENGEISVAEQLQVTRQQVNHVQKTLDFFLNQLPIGQRFEQAMREKDEKINQLENIINTQNQQLEQSNHQLEQALEEKQRAEDRIENVAAANNVLTRENDRLRQVLQRTMLSHSIAVDFIRKIVDHFNKFPSERAYSREMTVNGEVLMVIQNIPISLEDIHQLIQSSLSPEDLERYQPILSKMEGLENWLKNGWQMIERAPSALHQTQPSLFEGCEKEDLC